MLQQLTTLETAWLRLVAQASATSQATSQSYTMTTLQSCRKTVASTKTQPKFLNLHGIICTFRSFEY